MARHNVIILTDDVGTWVRDILQAAGYEVIVSDSGQETSDLIASLQPLAVILGDCIHDPRPDGLPESIHSHARHFPVVYWNPRNTEEHLLMVLAAIAAISSSYLSRTSGWGESKALA